MSLKETIITNALLGTEKKQVNPSDFPESLKVAVEGISGQDNETKFLQSASLALNYLKAGVKPLTITLPSNEAPEEEKAYCSNEASTVLKQLLSGKYPTLTWFWCKRCVDRNKIVQPEVLPELLEWGVSIRKQWPAIFSSVIGKRGVWLSQFSADLNFVNTADEETDWETSTLPQRIHLLHKLRMSNPAEAREKIASVWKEENAAARQELLETIAVGISTNDEQFLLQTLNDKSLKVKETALYLLKMIPGSEIMMKYRQILKDSFIVSTNKVLGLISKTTIDVHLKLPDEEIFKTGIQNLSNDKKISDENYVLMQLTGEVPPEFWTEHLNATPEEVVKMFASRDELKKFQQSLTRAVLKFNNKAWAKLLADIPDISYVSLLPLLEGADKARYAEYLLKVYPNITEIVNALRDEENPVEWNNNFSRQLLSTMAQDPYAYANLFESIAVYLPAAVMNDLDKFFPSEEWKRNYWQKISGQIKEYILLKEKIKAIF